MWLCKLNKIHLLYLPAHASHLLQPLDLAPFSVLKGRYRNEIRCLSALDDAAPIKREGFVVAYNKAREEALSDRIIRAGWKAGGLCPYNPDIVLQSSQINAWLSTPPPTEALEDASVLIFSTPQSSQALHKAQQQLLLSESLSRNTRIVLSKAGKAIAKANTRAADLQARNERLKYQLNACRITRTRKRVQVNLNERFGNIKSMKAAVDRAAALEAQQASKSAERGSRSCSSNSSSLT
jgi:hypothetical protein